MGILDKVKSTIGKFINPQETNVVINLELDSREKQKFHDAMVGDTGPNVQRREWEDYRGTFKSHDAWDREWEYKMPLEPRDRYNEFCEITVMNPDEKSRHYQKTLTNYGMKDLAEIDGDVETWRAREVGHFAYTNDIASFQMEPAEKQRTKETTLDPRVQKLLEMSPEEQAEITDTRTAALLNQLNNAECGLHAATLLDLNKDDEKYVKEFKRDKKHAEHGLTNIVRGKTLEDEVSDLLNPKRSREYRQAYYTEVLKSGGRKAVDELTSAVKKQRTKSNALEM